MINFLKLNYIWAQLGGNTEKILEIIQRIEKPKKSESETWERPSEKNIFKSQNVKSEKTSQKVPSEDLRDSPPRLYSHGISPFKNEIVKKNVRINKS